MTQEILSVSTTTNYLRFVECCSGAEILFRGTYPIVSGQVCEYNGTPAFPGFGGQLETDTCYTVFLEYTSGPMIYPPAPTFGIVSPLGPEGCDDLKCPSCIPPSLCQCPPGFIEIEPGVCEGEESILPTAPEIPLYVGNIFDSNILRGLLSWGSINGYTFPILCTPQDTSASSLSALTPIPNSGTNNITGDSWIGVSPPPQPGGNHAAITTASPIPYPNPNPLALPINPLVTKPYRESNINAGILEYGQGGIIPHTGYVSTPFWTTWYNSVAVWQDTDNITNRYAGFNVCVEPTQATTYQIVITGNNGYRIIIDDNLAVEAINGDGVTPSLAYANNFQITLQAGVHNIRVECYNYSGNGGLGCEILVCTYAVLAGITNLSQLVPYRVFSTLWKRSRPQSLTANGTNIVTAGSGTQPYDLGGYFQMSGVDPNIYITNVINATTYQVSQVIPSGVFTGNIRFIYNASNIEDNSYTCPDGYTLINCNGLACVRTIEIIIECKCYLIIPCDGSPTFISNNLTLANYLDGFHTVISPSYTGCAYILELVDITCEDAEDAYVNPLLPCECDLLCYFVSNSNGFLYVDINNELQQVSSLDAKPYVRICSKIYPLVENSSVDYEIINIGPCEDGECPVDCFKLTNCDTEEVIYTLSQALIPYVYGSNNVVNILNREGCWTASVLDEGEICDCPIDIIVTASFTTCEDCIPVVSYRLTSCINNDVIYTLDDLEVYVGQTVKLDCGCYIVHQLDIIPPNPQSVVVEDVFQDCIECLRTYWKLIDCNGVSEDIYTYTDLTLYENKVIKIEGCDTCWEVELTDEHINPITVNVVSSYDECIDCKTDLPCLCSKMTNVSDLPVDYAYLDCEHNLVDISLNPGVSTDKICAIQWYKKYCNCFIFEITTTTIPESSEIFPVTNTGEILNGYPVYSVCDGPVCNSLFFNGTNWVVTDALDRILYILQTQTFGSCPLGTWVDADGEPIPNVIIETYAEDTLRCAGIPFAYVDLFYTDYVEYFGECKQGVCPPPVFKNNRSVRPGYNTPNCNPDEYDKITCRFSQVMYKVVLEKRYGITNCCLDEDEKWLLKKELIDLQALKDPNYICPSCPCSCNSGKSYSSCNCLTARPVCPPPSPPPPPPPPIPLTYDCVCTQSTCECIEIENGSGEYSSLALCQAACVPAPFVTSYNCIDGSCVLVFGPSGTYPTVFDCQANCQPITSYNCTNGNCVLVSGSSGQYPTLIECQAACTPSWNCVDCECVSVAGPGGTFATLDDCVKSRCNDVFTTTWETTTVGESITLPYYALGTYSGTIDWGDSTTSVNSFATSTHIFATPGIYTITICGTTTGWNFSTTATSRSKIKSVLQWGQLRLGNNIGGYFTLCINLNLSSVQGTLDLTGITTLNGMFASCSSLTTINNINSWNTSAITNMSGMFQLSTSFNQALSFNTSAVTTMQTMFQQCTAFNSPLTFNTVSVLNMISMFQSCINFDQPLTFNTTLVNNMQQMFSGCTLFDSPLTFTSTAAVLNMSSMFSSCISFNQPLSFNTVLVNNMFGMFAGCNSFNQPLSFNTGAVTTMQSMFASCNVFNQPLNFNTTLVNNMQNMFSFCPVFDSALTFTSTALVTNMNGMFQGCTNFNKPLNFNTILVNSMVSMFKNCTNFNQNIGTWNISSVNNFTDFMLGKTPATWPTTYFDNLLCGWSTQTVVPSLTINFGTANYTNATGGPCYTILDTAPNNWTILSGGGV